MLSVCLYWGQNSQFYIKLGFLRTCLVSLILKFFFVWENEKLGGNYKSETYSDFGTEILSLGLHSSIVQINTKVSFTEFVWIGSHSKKQIDWDSFVMKCYCVLLLCSNYLVLLKCMRLILCKEIEFIYWDY